MLHEFRGFLFSLGAAGKIRFYDRLYFVDAQGRRSTMESSPLLRRCTWRHRSCFSSLNLADKRSIANAMMAIATAGGHSAGIDGLSMLDWLQQMKQTPAAIDRFWRVVLVSALDEEFSRTDTRYGIEVFWKGFLANKNGYRVGIPSVPLAELYEGCREAVLRRGGGVRVRAGIREIRVRDDRFEKCRNG